MTDIDMLDLGHGTGLRPFLPKLYCHILMECHSVPPLLTTVRTIEFSTFILLQKVKEKQTSPNRIRSNPHASPTKTSFFIISPNAPRFPKVPLNPPFPLLVDIKFHPHT
ncbi:Uncharacterized protein HZ326_16050 [Fusarium oxysporum f. sp. albedinis]|nr:Uncharacterized protein HZ326_16050 [Fusarium oxysporum f. sp. albedinis]